MFLKVPIIGTGTQADPYRAKLPAGIESSAVIPTSKDGRPIDTACLVVVDDKLSVPLDAVKYQDADALGELLTKEPRLNIDKLKVKGALRVPVEVTAMVGFLAASRSPVDRRWLLKAGLVAAGGFLFSTLLAPRKAHALTRTTLATDSFTRANNASLGSDWEGGYGVDDFRIVSTAAQPPAGAPNGNGRGTYKTVVPANDQWGQLRVSALSGAVYNHSAVILRGAAPATYTGYYCTLERGGNFPSIAKHIAGAFTALSFGSYAYAGNELLSAEVSGTGLELFINGVSKTTTTDASIASGRVGIGYYGPGIADGSLIIDDVSLGDFSVVGPGSASRLPLLGVN